MGTLPNEPVQLLLFSASRIAHLGHTVKLSHHACRDGVTDYIFLAIAFTCMGLLNISFSPAHYIFLEITLSQFTATLQAVSTKCQQDALGHSVGCYCLDMEEFV